MRRARIAVLFAALLTIPVAIALAQPDEVPTGTSRLEVHVRNEADAGFIRLRVTDAQGREAIDELERLPSDGAWAIGAQVADGVYRVTLTRASGVWPFHVRIVSDGDVDLQGCASHRALARFVTTFEGADEGVLGPMIECAA